MTTQVVSNPVYQPQKSPSIDYMTWPLWVELESEPAYFNTMLSEMGVPGLKVQEVIDFDEIPFLAQPVHALIFLYKYKESPKNEVETGNTHDDVWFARQTPHDACATYALLNIVNNIPDFTLSTALQNFKNATSRMTPLERGCAVDDLHFVRAIHNSFATGNELITADQSFHERVEKDKKAKVAAAAKKAREERAAAKKLLKAAKEPGQPARVSARQKLASGLHSATAGHVDKKIKLTNGAAKQFNKNGTPAKRRSALYRRQTGEEEAAYHFCAYMPINGRFFKLDGLEDVPQDLGAASGSWLDIAVPEVQAWIAQYDDNIEFNLMAVTDNPYTTAQNDMAAHGVFVGEIDRKLDALTEGWRDLITPEHSQEAFGSFDYHLAAPVSLRAAHNQKLDEADDLSTLLDLRKEAVSAILMARGAVRDEQLAVRNDEKKSFHRRHDYASFVRAWLDELADADLLTELMSKV